MATQRTTYRLTKRDLKRVRQLRDRYQLQSDTDAVRWALVLALRQQVMINPAKVQELIESET